MECNAKERPACSRGGEKGGRAESGATDLPEGGGDGGDRRACWQVGGLVVGGWVGGLVGGDGKPTTNDQQCNDNLAGGALGMRGGGLTGGGLVGGLAGGDDGNVQVQRALPFSHSSPTAPG